MSFMSGLGVHLVSFLSYTWGLLLYWLSILFYLPFKNPEVLWVIIPVWIAWFFAEFFQEKKKTSFGNAISNGVIPVWVSIDWTRLLISHLTDGTAKFSGEIIIKFSICLFVLVYGLVIIIGGIKTKGFIHYLGRTREVTYLLAMFTPLVYGVVDITGKFFLTVIIFFPVFYFVIELIDRLTPDPSELKEEDTGATDTKTPSEFDLPDFNPSHFSPSVSPVSNSKYPNSNPTNFNPSAFSRSEYPRSPPGRF